MTSQNDNSTDIPLVILGRMEGKLDMTISRMDDHAQELRALGGRVSKLEALRNILIGISVASGPTGFGIAKLLGY